MEFNFVSNSHIGAIVRVRGQTFKAERETADLWQPKWNGTMKSNNLLCFFFSLFFLNFNFQFFKPIIIFSTFIPLSAFPTVLFPLRLIFFPPL